eukprot:TRINITY_DN11440_c0_g1_i1.p1 TRINITY_DN11440_c0_g1~~TRINITY_DN11440_c0_g1_i1.p1  ORF type:complete len:292 (-),score=53.71 TRINITY_DN11440_c0_g1_i1:67-942(-)
MNSKQFSRNWNYEEKTNQQNKKNVNVVQQNTGKPKTKAKPPQPIHKTQSSDEDTEELPQVTETKKTLKKLSESENSDFENGESDEIGSSSDSDLVAPNFLKQSVPTPLEDDESDSDAPKAISFKLSKSVEKQNLQSNKIKQQAQKQKRREFHERQKKLKEQKEKEIVRKRSRPKSPLNSDLLPPELIATLAAKEQEEHKSEIIPSKRKKFRSDESNENLDFPVKVVPLSGIEDTVMKIPENVKNFLRDHFFMRSSRVKEPLAYLSRFGSLPFGMYVDPESEISVGNVVQSG